MRLDELATRERRWENYLALSVYIINARPYNTNTCCDVYVYQMPPRHCQLQKHHLGYQFYICNWQRFLTSHQPPRSSQKENCNWMKWIINYISTYKYFYFTIKYSFYNYWFWISQYQFKQSAGTNYDGSAFNLHGYGSIMKTRRGKNQN